MVMNHGQIQLTNIIVVALFRHQLFVTAVGLFVAMGMLLLLGVILTGRVRTFNLSSEGIHEPRSRSYLRFAFGAIWVVDGILQFQPSMPLGLGNGVVAQAIPGTPQWLHSLMNSSITLWNEHPLALAVGTAWIQIGIGLLLLLSNGRVGRAAAVVSVGWAGLIWLIGNGAGGIFSTSGSLLFGWPGATLFYVVAGVWLAVFNGYFADRFSRWTLRFIAVVVALGALRQLLPSDGFWHGGNSNALTAMAQTMTQSAQPHWIAWIALHGGDLAGTLGGGANLIIVLWLAVTAVGLWLVPSRSWNWPVWSLVVFAVLFWFVAQDAAFFGGLATDFNSLIPLAALTFCAAPRFGLLPALPRRLPAELRSLSAAVLASFAAAMVIYSIGSMAWATLQPTETTFYVAANGLASSVDSHAPGFTLEDQSGARYSLGEHAGHYTLLTFLDPVCWTDCPLLAAQMKQVRAELGANAKIDYVAVAANPLHETLSNVRHFIAGHQLSGISNFYFVTGSLKDLRAVWSSYGITVQSTKSSRMSIHSDYFFVITPQGHLRWIVPDDPLTGGAATQSSDTSELVSLLRQVGAA